MTVFIREQWSPECILKNNDSQANRASMALKTIGLPAMSSDLHNYIANSS